jgi:uracil-DNA glycosylase family 4
MTFGIRQKPDSCIGCPCHPHGTDFSAPEGTGSLGVMVIGEASGDWEARDQLPFRPWAQAGSVLNRVIRLADFTREQFVISNILRCRPANDWLENAPWEYGAIAHCRPNLDRLISERKPKAIWALGGIATRELTGMAGKHCGVTMLQGYVLPGPNDIPVIPSVHPSHISRGASEYYMAAAEQLKRCVGVARNGFTRKPTDYITHPSLEDALQFLRQVRDNPNRLLTYDIETPNSRDMAEDERDDDPSYQIESVQFSLAPYTGIFFPYRDQYIDIAKQILALENRKAGWNNKRYDDPRLRHNGFILNGLIEDFMHKWHAIQPDLPQNLQFAGQFLGMDYAWKHMSASHPELYGCADVDAPQRADSILTSTLRRFKNTWQPGETIEDAYNVYIRDFYTPVLAPMSERGVPINNEKRLAFGEVLDKQHDKLYDLMQDHVPEELRNVSPKKGYVRPPKDTTGLVKREFDVANVDDDLFQNSSTGSVTNKVTRWCRVEPFVPSSGVNGQLLRYIRFRKHPVPKKHKEVNPDGSKKDTTEAKELERLFVKTGDMLYKWVQEYRALQTMKSTFVDGYAPGADGCVHGSFTLNPAQWQLSSVKPNLQNMPMHVDLADEFLKCMEAPSGYKWVAMDFKSFHPLMLAFEAQDEQFMRLVRMDIHSYITAHFMKIPDRDRLLSLSDDELRDQLRYIRKQHEHVRDYKCKRVACGWGNGEGFRLCFQQWREYFTNETECKKLFQLLEALFPKTAKRKIKMTLEASPYPEHGGKPYLISRYGAMRWFWETYRYDSRKHCLVAGADYNKAQAFYGPNDAFGHMRDRMLEVTQRGFAESWRMVNNVHDALYFLPPDHLVEECVHWGREIMQAPNKRLVDPVIAPDGMWVEVGVKVGQNLSKKSPNNPGGLEELSLPRPPYPLYGGLTKAVAV